MLFFTLIKKIKGKQFISEDRASISYFSKLGEDLNIKLRKIIEDNTVGNNLGYMKKIRTYYHSCRNTSRLKVDCSFSCNIHQH